MAKGDRRHKREEIRRIVAEDERRRKEKEQKKSQPRKTNYRRDKEGNIILFGNLKFSKTAIGVLAGIVGIAVFFYIMSHGVGEMEGYIEPEFSFASCEANNFEPSMCKFYYKFCKTFADGVDVCEFALEDPFKDIDDSERKWTEEEQDFLPPTEYLPFLQYAEARGADEPTCYSSACKEEHPETGTDEESEKTVVEAKQDVTDVKAEIKRLQDQITDWEKEEFEYKNDLWSAESLLEDAEDEYKEEKRNHRHAMDVKVQSTDDIEMQKEAKREFKDATLKLKSAQAEYAQEKNRYDNLKQDIRDAKNALIQAMYDLEDSMDAVNESKVNANQKKNGDNKFINIVLSRGCLTLIENNMTTNCPTYRELRDTWDNTESRISGEWIDLGYDIKRENSKMEQYHRYYQSLPSWKIITVDPDPQMLDRGITITIQASDFVYHENIKSADKSMSYNQTGLVQYDWHNVKYHDNCREVLMAPHMDLLPDIINNLWEGCERQKPVETLLSFEKMTGENSPFYAYTDWLQKAMERCLTKC